MSEPPSLDKLAGVGDAAVHKATGRGWQAWLEELDAAGAAEWEHKAIARWIGESHPEVSGWWAQMLTVGYEQARGLREVNEKSDGFSANKSRTFPVPVEELYGAWADEERRVDWIGGVPHAVRTATAPKSMRITWEPDGSSVDVYFTAKEAGKSSVQVQQNKLADNAAVGAAKEFWTSAFERLAAELAEPAGPAD